MDKEQVKICPLFLASSFVGVERASATVECKGSRCAWYVLGECAMSMIAWCMAGIAEEDFHTRNMEEAK